MKYLLLFLVALFLSVSPASARCSGSGQGKVDCPGKTAPWYCPVLKSAISKYGDKASSDFAVSRGYTVQQYLQAKRECLHG